MPKYNVDAMRETLSSATIAILFAEIATFWLGLSGTEVSGEYYYTGWLLIAGGVNLVILILHLIKRQKYYFLFVVLLITVPVAPVAILFLLLSGMGR